MFLVALKKNIIMEFMPYRLNSQYFGTPKSGAPKMRGFPPSPATAGIAGGVPTPLNYSKLYPNISGDYHTCVKLMQLTEKEIWLKMFLFVLYSRGHAGK